MGKSEKGNYNISRKFTMNKNVLWLEKSFHVRIRNFEFNDFFAKQPLNCKHNLSVHKLQQLVFFKLQHKSIKISRPLFGDLAAAVTYWLEVL